ncbi:MAG: site-2 protease family protein [Chthoniobacteraceae bacterium]
MRWSIHIARIAGIDVKIHVTFLLLLGFLGFAFYNAGGMTAAVESVFFICLVFFCVLLHEFGHAMAARRYGIHTPDITLLPIGGIARLERMPDKPAEEVVVAIAGPLVNVAIAAVLYPLVSGHLDWRVLERGGGDMLSRLFMTNIALVMFNLIPAFPMDGGRVFRALLAMRMDYARATNIAASVGQFIAIAGGLIALMHQQPMLVLIAAFIYFAAQNEASFAQMKTISVGTQVSSAMVTRFEALPRTATLNDAVEAVLHTSQHDFPVVDEKGVVCGVLMRDDLIVGLRKNGPGAPVAEMMRIDVPSVHHSMPFERAFALMQETGADALPVLDGFGRLVGLFTPENVGELMMIQSALGRAPSFPATPMTQPPPLPKV